MKKQKKLTKQEIEERYLKDSPIIDEFIDERIVFDPKTAIPIWSLWNIAGTWVNQRDLDVSLYDIIRRIHERFNFKFDSKKKWDTDDHINWVNYKKKD